MASLKFVAHLVNVASLSILSDYHFSRYSSELAELVPLHYSCGMSTHYSKKLNDFYVTVSRFHKDVYINSFFPCTGRPGKFLLQNADNSSLNSFKFRVNKYFLSLDSFSTHLFSSFSSSFSCNSMHCSGKSVLHGMNHILKYD